MPNGVPAGLLALAAGTGNRQGFGPQFAGSLGLLANAQSDQAAASSRQFEQMLKMAAMEREIQAEETAAAQQAQQRATQQAYLQTVPQNQQAMAAAAPNEFLKAQIGQAFQDPSERFRVVGTDLVDISGQQPEVALRGRRAPSQVETVRLEDGTVRSFRRDDPALDKALQQGGVRFTAQVQSPDIAGIGGATASTQTRAQQTLDTATDTIGVIQQFRESLRPENVGLSGDIRGVGIGALGQMESFKAWANDETNNIIEQAITAGDTLNLSKFAVDPALSSQKMLENVLAYRLAKINDPSGRVSDKDFDAAQRSLGFGKKLTSIGDVFARVDAMEKTVLRTKGIAQQRLGIATPESALPSSGRAPRRLRFDAQGNLMQ